MAVAPWIASDLLWQRIEPLLPKVERRFRYPGRKRLDDRAALQGILFVLHRGSRGGTCRSSSAGLWLDLLPPRRARARLIEPETVRNTISWSMRAGSRSHRRSQAATATT
jgi:hypothetical protein